MLPQARRGLRPTRGQNRRHPAHPQACAIHRPLGPSVGWAKYRRTVRHAHDQLPERHRFFDVLRRAQAGSQLDDRSDSQARTGAAPPPGRRGTSLRGPTKRIANAVGTPGTAPSTTAVFLAAGRILTNNTCPRGRGQRHLMLEAETEESMIAALQGLFNPTGTIGKQYDTAEMGYALGMEWNVDQNVYSHTVGTFSGTPLVNVGGQSGGDIDTDGWTSTTLNEGDVLTFDGVFAVNPVTKATLGNLAQFVVTAQISDTAGAINVPISPSMVGPGSPFQNVAGLPANNTPVNVLGASATVSPQNLVWNKEAVTVAVIGLKKPEGVNQASVKYDDKSGVGIRYIEWYDGDSDLWKSRFDVVYGILAQRPEWACRIAA